VNGENASSRGWRIAAAIVVFAWLAPAVWLLIKVLDGDAKYRAARPQATGSPFSGLGMLLLPTLVLAGLAVVLLLFRQRVTAGWTIVFLFALLGLPAWLFLRGSAYDPGHWVSRDVVTSVVWMVAGLLVYLLALSLAMLHGRPAPADVHVSQQFMGAPGTLHTNTPTGGDPLVDREPNDPHES
jgi:hypothetical protein